MLLFTSFLVFLILDLTNASCSVSSAEAKADANDDATYQDGCMQALLHQVRIEFEASFQYILMAAHFDQDSVNLPNVAKLFWTHADEERDHAIQFMQYLRMRGAEDNEFFAGGPIQPKGRAYDWQGVEDALSLALEMEKEVTARMKLMIDVCSEAGAEDYHAGDWLTGTWLEEQYQGQRHLAGLINTFNNFKRGHEEFAEWMFDQEL